MRYALRILIAVVVVLAVVVLVRFLSGPDDGRETVVEKHGVGHGTIEQTVTGTGVLASATSAEIVSKVEGTFGTPLVKEGHAVVKDQVLLRIGNDEIVTTYNLKKTEIAKLEKDRDEKRKPPQERAEVKKAKAAWDRTKADYDRKKLQLDDEKEKGSATSLSARELEELEEDVEFARRDTELAKDAYDEALDAITEADVREAEEKVTQAQAELDKLQEQVDGREVRSPIKGVVLKVMVEPEAIAVDPDKVYPKDTPLFAVADLESILVRGRIYQSDAAKLDRQRVDDPELDDAERIEAKVHLTGESRHLMGRLTYVSLTPTESSSGVGQFEVKIKFPTPPENVRDGLQVSFDIIVKRLDDVLVVPVRFVELEGGKAFVRKAGASARVEVQLGVSDNNFWQVTGGLQEGDEIEWQSTSK